MRENMGSAAEELVFYGYFRSSAAYRCRIAFNLKGVSPAFVPVHLRKGEQRSPEHLARNPQGFVPVLKVGDRMLSQSLAIIEWLDEVYPAPPLLPPTPLEKSDVRSLALMIACDIHPVNNLKVLDHLRNSFSQDQAGIESWCRHWIGIGLQAFEARLAQTSGRFCFGDSITLADICLLPQIFAARRFNADMSAFSTINRIVATCEGIEAFAAAHPSRQSDAEA